MPTPGPPSFAVLCKTLAAYDLDSSKVTFDAPCTRFGDVTLGIALLENRVPLRLTPVFLELYVTSLYVGDEEKIIGIVNGAFAALREVEPDSSEGEAHIRIASHIKLAPLENFALLHDHLKMSDSVSDLIPEAAIYQVDVPKESGAKELRVAIAKSIPFEDSLFLDVNAIYPGPMDTASLATQIESDFNLVAERIGLKEKTEQQ